MPGPALLKERGAAAGPARLGAGAPPCLSAGGTKAGQYLQAVLFGFGWEGVCSVLCAQFVVPEIWQ